MSIIRNLNVDITTREILIKIFTKLPDKSDFRKCKQTYSESAIWHFLANSLSSILSKFPESVNNFGIYIVHVQPSHSCS